MKMAKTCCSIAVFLARLCFKTLFEDKNRLVRFKKEDKGFKLLQRERERERGKESNLSLSPNFGERGVGMMFAFSEVPSMSTF